MIGLVVTSTEALATVVWYSDSIHAMKCSPRKTPAAPVSMTSRRVNRRSSGAVRAAATGISTAAAVTVRHTAIARPGTSPAQRTRMGAKAKLRTPRLRTT